MCCRSRVGSGPGVLKEDVGAFGLRCQFLQVAASVFARSAKFTHFNVQRCRCAVDVALCSPEEASQAKQRHRKAIQNGASVSHFPPIASRLQVTWCPGSVACRAMA
eukprot:1507482-Alexandrium_andersonii.AAC.1